MLRDTDPDFNEFMTVLQNHRNRLLGETMKSGCSDAQASEFRYTARGLDDVLTLVRGL